VQHRDTLSKFIAPSAFRYGSPPYISSLGVWTALQNKPSIDPDGGVTPRPIYLEAQESNRMARAEGVVGTDVRVVARDVNVAYMLTHIEIGPCPWLEYVDVPCLDRP
jgi:hypothetical protein